MGSKANTEAKRQIVFFLFLFQRNVSNLGKIYLAEPSKLPNEILSGDFILIDCKNIKFVLRQEDKSLCQIRVPPIL